MGGQPPGAAPVSAYTSRLARLRLEGGFQQAETVQAFLLGRDLVLDAVHQGLPEAQFVEAAHRVDGAFQQVIASYSATFCSLCSTRQEEQRTRLERHLESVMERSQDAMILFDEERRIRSWNTGAQAMLGYDAKEAIGQGLSLLVPEEGHPEIDAMWDELRHRAHIRLSETQVRRCKPGARIHASLRHRKGRRR